MLCVDGPDVRFTLACHMTRLATNVTKGSRAYYESARRRSWSWGSRSAGGGFIRASSRMRGKSFGSRFSRSFTFSLRLERLALMLDGAGIHGYVASSVLILLVVLVRRASRLEGSISRLDPSKLIDLNLDLLESVHP